jgi:hypothetical protein
MYRMRVTATRDRSASPSLQVAEIYFYHPASSRTVDEGCINAASSITVSSLQSFIVAVVGVIIMMIMV